jgi:hypothetical protein
LDCATYQFTERSCLWNECKTDFKGNDLPCTLEKYSKCEKYAGNDYGECIPADYDTLPKVYPSTEENVCTHLPEFDKLEKVRTECKKQFTEGTCSTKDYCQWNGCIDTENWVAKNLHSFTCSKFSALYCQNGSILDAFFKYSGEYYGHPE